MTADTETVHEGKSGKMRVILTSWAAVATALFLFTLIFGAVYVININPECDDTDSKVSSTETAVDKKVELNVKKGEKEEKETIHENTAAHTDFIIKKNSDGFIELIVGVDYNRKMSCVYLAREDVCVLSVGEDLDWYDDAVDDKNTTIELKDDDVVAHKKILKNKVTDLSLLTSEMQIICSGKDIYWASPEEDNEDTDVAIRNKRYYCCYYYYYYYRCLKYYYGYYYWGYCYYNWCYSYYCYGR